MEKNNFLIKIHKLILNHMINHNYDYDLILKESQKLDKYILNNLKEQNKLMTKEVTKC